MPYDTSSRWFEPTTVAEHIRYMTACCSKATGSGLSAPSGVSVTKQDRQNQRTKATIFAGVGTAVALAVLIGALVTFAKPVPGKERNNTRFALVCLVVIAGVSAVT